VGFYLAQFVQVLFQVLIFAILIRALMSWFPVAQGSAFMRILDDVTEPILSPLRKVVPRLGMMDITPIVAMIGLQILQQILVSGLQSI
jgi:YggT family protein